MRVSTPAAGPATRVAGTPGCETLAGRTGLELLALVPSILNSTQVKEVNVE